MIKVNIKKVISIPLLLLSIVLFSSIGFGALTDGLISYYSFDGNGNDATGYINTSVTGATNITGKIGQAYSFDGVNDVITRNSTGLITGNNARTIAFWFQLNNFGGANKNSLLAYGVGNNQQMSILDINNGGSQDARFWGYFADFNSGVTTSLNTWYHLTYTHDGTTSKLYINGAYANGATLSLNTQATNLTIGYENLFATHYSTIKMDELGLWNRALSSAEISQLYNNANGYAYPFLTPLNFTYTKTCYFNGTGLSLNLMSGCY
jgi:hypothetical protein